MCGTYCHGVEAICFQFGDISCTDAVGLDAVDVDDEVLHIYNWISYPPRELMGKESYIIIEVVARVGSRHFDGWADVFGMGWDGGSEELTR